MKFNGSPSDWPPVLLIHGAFAGAWMWEGVFLDSMTKAGWSALALDRPDQSDRASVNWGQTSYQSIVRRAVEECATPPILVTHSLGALLAQRLLGRTRISALVMLAPVPPPDV